MGGCEPAGDHRLRKLLGASQLFVRPAGLRQRQDLGTWGNFALFCSNKKMCECGESEGTDPRGGLKNDTGLRDKHRARQRAAAPRAHTPTEEVTRRVRHCPGLSSSAAQERVSLIAAGRTCSHHHRVRSMLLNKRSCTGTQTRLAGSGGREQGWVTLGVTPSCHCAVSSLKYDGETLCNSPGMCTGTVHIPQSPQVTRGLELTQQPDAQHPGGGGGGRNPHFQH